jgi:membrane protease YdiL (CAAX protease family)
MAYAPHETLTDPAQASRAPWRLLVGMILMVALYLPLAMAYATVVRGSLGIAPGALFDGSSPAAVLVLLAEFGLLIAVLAIALRLLHWRGLGSLIGPRDTALAHFWRCARLLLPLYAVILILPEPEPYRLTGNLALGTWLTWLPLALPCLFIQIAAEELIFRGYMQSQLAARFRNPLVWMVIPSVIFGALHYSPALAGDNAWMLALWATLFGVAAADLTARTGTLGPALALHFINNLFAIFITAPRGDLDGMALYTFPLALDDPAMATVILPIEILFTLCAWLTARLALRV